MSKKTTKKSTAVVQVEKAAGPALPADLQQQLIADAGAGFEHMTAQDYALPFLGLIQSMSPQRRRADEKYIQGADEGMFFNTVTNELYDGEDGVRIIPVHYEKVYNEWKPDRGGFVASHPDRDAAYRNMRDQENDIVETAIHYVLVEGADGDWNPAILSLKSSGLRASRRWNSMLQMLKLDGPGGKRITPPMFASLWRLTSVSTKNEKGDFYVPAFKHEGYVWDVDPSLYQTAREFRDAVAGGTYTANFAREEGGTAAGVVDEEQDPAF